MTRAIGLLAFGVLAGRPLAAQDVSIAPAPLDTAAILASARPDIDAALAAWLPGLRRRDAQAIAAAYADCGLFIVSKSSRRVVRLVNHEDPTAAFVFTS